MKKSSKKKKVSKKKNPSVLEIEMDYGASKVIIFQDKAGGVFITEVFPSSEGGISGRTYNVLKLFQCAEQISEMSDKEKYEPKLDLIEEKSIAHNEMILRLVNRIETLESLTPRFGWKKTT